MRLTYLAVGLLGAAAASLQASATAEAATAQYICSLSKGNVCDDPLKATVAGEVTKATGGFGFDLDGDGSPSYVKVSNSDIIDLTDFPITVASGVRAVEVPSRAVGDYDVVRGNAAANYRIEIVARNNRTTARASCYFKGEKNKGVATGGPDLSRLPRTGWHRITCQNTGTAIKLFVDNTLVATTTASTGRLPNPGPLFLGAKDANGGDQFSGYARNVRIAVG